MKKIVLTFLASIKSRYQSIIRGTFKKNIMRNGKALQTKKQKTFYLIYVGAQIRMTLMQST